MPGTASLIEKQFTRLDLDRRLLESFRRDEENGRMAHPVVTISRQMGSGGKTIGKMVAGALGFAFYDREIIDGIARETGSSADHIAQVEEPGHDGFTGLMLNLLDRRHVTDTVYLRSLLRVLRRVSDEGRAVILGRGGACVLREALKVRVIASFETRVHRMAEAEKLSAKEAEHRVLAFDYQQKRFLHNYFGCNVDEALLYDLAINTEAMALEHAAELIVRRVRQLWPEGKS